MIISLKSSIKEVVPIDKNSLGFYILGLIAKKGPLVEHQIVKQLALGTRRRVNTVFQNYLIPFDFVRFKKPKNSRRNIKNAFGKGKEVKPKEYYLTFKGIIGSLIVTKLQDNYLIKKYLSNINSQELANAQLNFMNEKIRHFIIHNYLRGISIHKMSDVIDWLEDYDSIHGFNSTELRMIQELNDKLSDCWYNVDVELGSQNKEPDMFMYCKYWHYALNYISKNFSFKKTLSFIYDHD